MRSTTGSNNDLASQLKPAYTEQQVIHMLRTIFVDHDGQVDLKQFPGVRQALDDKFMLSDSFSSQSDLAVFDVLDVKGSGFVSFKNSLPWQLQRLRQKKRLMETQSHFDERDALSNLVMKSSRKGSKESDKTMSKTASSTMPSGFDAGRRRSEPLIGDHFSQSRTASNSTAVRTGNGIIASTRGQNRSKKLHIQEVRIKGASPNASPRSNSRSPSPPQMDRPRSPQCPGPNYKYERGQWRLKTAKKIISDLDDMERIAKKARDMAKYEEMKNFRNMYKTNDTVATNLIDDSDTDDEA